MNVLDENIVASQRAILRRWRIPVRQIGYDLGWKGMTDEDILPLLLELRRPTFFPQDRDFFQRELCHARHCLVRLNVSALQAAAYIRRLLRHPEFDTQAKRMGRVVLATPTGLLVWHLRAEERCQIAWE